MDCIMGPDNQITISGCLSQQFNRADIELNESYQALLLMQTEGTKQQPELAAARQSLIRAQRAWLAFRDQDCRAVTTAVPHDPAIDSRNTQSLITRTEQRVTELKKWASIITATPRSVVTTVDSGEPLPLSRLRTGCGPTGNGRGHLRQTSSRAKTPQDPCAQSVKTSPSFS
ncbi:MAG: lysozyme inhibitor LprI family protein [Ideonella sp.]